MGRKIVEDGSKIRRRWVDNSLKIGRKTFFVGAEIFVLLGLSIYSQGDLLSRRKFTYVCDRGNPIYFQGDLLSRRNFRGMFVTVEIRSTFKEKF